jgi:hypothetical protein
MDPPYLVKRLSYFYKHKVPLYKRGAGLFKLGDKFRKGNATLTIVEVVPYGMYPTMRPRLKVRGYYREHESYIVQDERGNYRWPLVGSLLKMARVK